MLNQYLPNDGKHNFRLTLSSLYHLWIGGTRLHIGKAITIPRTVLILDVSKWQGEIDFVKMKAEGVDGVIIKCGQGTTKDPRFDENWRKAKAAGLLRGTYYFFDSRFNPTFQAYWWNEWTKHDRGELVHAADYEESYGGGWGGWRNLKAMIIEFQRLSRLTNEWIVVYSSYYYWIANSPTNESDLAWFGQYALWEAWYTTNPANVIIPRPWDNTPAKFWAWQYGTNGVDGQTPNGIKYGCQSIEVDENNPNCTETEYHDRYGGEVTPPPVDVSTFPHDGMKLISGIRYGWKFKLLISDPDKVRYELVSTPTLETVPSVTERKSATFGSNAGEWDRVSAPKDYTVSNGVVVKQRVEPVPSFQVGSLNNVFVEHTGNTARQAFSGLRYLIVNGSIQDYLSGNEPQYTEGHARMIAGVSGVGHAMAMLSEGVYPNQGLTLKQCAEIMKQYGCVKCADFGGGGDAGGILDGEDLIKPENIVNGQNVYRRLPMTFLIYAKDETMKRYQVVWDNGVSKRLRPTTSAASTGTAVPKDAIVDVAEDNIPDETYPTNPNRIWVRFSDNTYGASKYDSVRMIDVTPPPVDPPPDDEGMKVNYAVQETFPQEGRMRWSVRRNNGETEFTDYPI